MKQIIDELQTRDGIKVWSDDAAEDFLKQQNAKAMYLSMQKNLHPLPAFRTFKQQ
jgi:hypothetical protein